MGDAPARRRGRDLGRQRRDARLHDRARRLLPCRHHGGAAGRYVDAHNWVIASFFQHDSRDHDPQLHIHTAGLNRVQGRDGVWRTIDGRSLYRWRGAGGAVAERVLFERLAATHGLQSAMRPDGKSRELVGVSQRTMDLFSSRRRAITPRTAELVEAFETKHGRAPNALQLDRLSRQATFATRRAKTHDGELREAMLERWDRALRAEIDGGLAGVADDVLALAGQVPEAATWSPAAVIGTALEEVQRSKASWTVSDFTRAISDALPDHLGIPDGERLGRLLDTLTREGIARVRALDAERPGERDLPDELRLDNGDSAYQVPGAGSTRRPSTSTPSASSSPRRPSVAPPPCRRRRRAGSSSSSPSPGSNWASTRPPRCRGF